MKTGKRTHQKQKYKCHVKCGEYTGRVVERAKFWPCGDEAFVKINDIPVCKYHFVKMKSDWNFYNTTPEEVTLQFYPVEPKVEIL